MSDVFYSAFFPDETSFGVKGTTMPAVSGDTVVDIVKETPLGEGNLSEEFSFITKVDSLPTTKLFESRIVYYQDKLWTYKNGEWKPTIASEQEGVGELTLENFPTNLRPQEVVTALPGPPHVEGRLVYLKTDDKLYRNTGSGWTSATSTSDLTGTLGSNLFSNSLRPPEVVTSLPASGNFQGKLVILTTDSKVYRWTDSGWTKNVDTADLTGTISDTQLAGMSAGKLIGQLTNAQIAAIDAAKVAGQLTNAQIADIDAAKVSGQLTNAQIAAIDAAKVAGQLTNAQIADIDAAKVSGQLTNAQIAAIDAAKVSGQLTNAQIAAIDAAKVSGQLTNTQIADIDAAKVSGQLVNTQLANGAITISKMAADLTAVEIVSALPSTGNKPGRTVYFNGKLYRWTSTTTTGTASWTAEVASTDIAGQLTDSQIGALAATKISGQLTNAQIADLAATKLTGQLVNTQIADGVVTVAKMANGLTGIESVGALPSTGNFRGRTVMLQTDGKLYRWNNTATTGTTYWTAAIPSSDLTGQLTDGQIAAVSALKLTGQITATQITDKAITTAKLATGSVVTDILAANAVTTAKLTIGNFVNLIPNPNFDFGVSEWASSNQQPTSILSNDASVPVGASNRRVMILPRSSGGISSHGVHVGLMGSSGAGFEVSEGQQYQVRVRAYRATGTTNADLYIWGLKKDGTTAPISYLGTVTTVDQWQVVTKVITIPAGFVRAQFYFYRSTASDTGDYFVDSVEVSRRYGGELIVDGAITTDKLSANAVTADKITAGAISTAALAASAVSADKIASNAITSDKIVTGAITTDKLTTGAVTADKILANAITSDKIVTEAITAAKLAANAVTADKITAGAVTAAAIAANTITGNNIAGGTITGGHIASRTISAGNIVAQSITGFEILGDTITGSHIKGSTITGGNIAGGTITGGHIAANTIQGTHIAANTIAASKMAISGANINPDMGYNDDDFWNWNGDYTGWYPEVSENSGSLGTKFYTVWERFFTGTGARHKASRRLAPYAVKVGTTVGVRIPIENNSNRYVVVGLEFFNKAGQIIANCVVGSNAYSGFQNLFESTVVPTGTYDVSFVMYADAGPAFAGNIKVGMISAIEMMTGQLIVDGSITASEIAANTITGAKIVGGTILGGHIAANTITTGNLAANSVTGNNIVGGTILGGHIAANTIVGGNIAAATIQGGNIEAGTILGGHIAANTITAANLTAGIITAGYISAGAITADKIAANTITGDKIVGGTILGGHIAANTIRTGNLLVQAFGSNANPDPYFKDIGSPNSFWDVVYPNGWYQEVGSSTLEAMGVPSGLVLWAGAVPAFSTKKYVHTSVRPIGATAGQKVRLRAKVNNGSNQVIYAQVEFFNSANTSYTESLSFDANTGLTTQEKQFAIPTWATQWRFLVTNQGGTTFQGAAFLSDFQVEKAVDSNMIVDGSITAQKLVVGSITGAYIAADTITAKNLAIGNFDNIIPDGNYRDHSFWKNTDTVTNFPNVTEANGAWTDSRFLQFIGGGYKDVYSKFFVAEPGATYKVTYRIYTGDMSGGWFQPLIHVPNTQWQSILKSGSAGNNVPAESIGDINNNTGSYIGPGNDTGDKSYMFYNPTGVPENANKRIQFRFLGNFTGAVYMQIKIVRVSDTTLIAGGAITADKIAVNAVTADKITAGAVTAGKINVTNLSAINANMGNITAGSMNINGRTLLGSDGNIQIRSGDKGVIMGSGMGKTGDLVMYVGPRDDNLGLLDKNNAAFYLDQNGNGGFSGIVRGSLISASAIELGSTRIHCGSGRLAPFIITEIANARSANNNSPGNLTATISGFISPNNGSGYNSKRFARHKMDVMLEAFVYGDFYMNYLYIDVMYHNDGNWINIGSTSGEMGGRASQQLAMRYTSYDSSPSPWSQCAFRARTTGDSTLSLLLRVTVLNFNESGNEQNTNSGTNTGNGAGGAPPSTGGSTGGGDSEPYCVDYETTVLPDGRFVRDLQIGDVVDAWNESGRRPEVVQVPVRNMDFGHEESYKITTETGVSIIQSASTPMTMRDGGVMYTPHLLNEDVLVNRNNTLAWEKVTSLEAVGVRKVVKATMLDSMYFAGMSANATIATHNIPMKREI